MHFIIALLARVFGRDCQICQGPLSTHSLAKSWVFLAQHSIG